MRPSAAPLAAAPIPALWHPYLLTRASVVIALTLALLVLTLSAGGAALDQLRATPLAAAGRALAASVVMVTAGAALFAVLSSRQAATGAASLSRLPALTLAAGGLAIAALTLDAPWRLASNVLCFSLLTGPLVWLTSRRSGDRAALDAALACCAFALVPAALNTPPPPATREFEPVSPYRWSVGFPTPAWRIRHEIRLAHPLDDVPLELLVWLARPQDGRAQLVAWVNGNALGTLREEDYNTRVVAIPRGLSAFQSVLQFEVTATEPDRTLRVLAHPWPGGATAGAEASSYFDGQRWRPGTFNDLAHGAQRGVYLIALRGVWR